MVVGTIWRRYRSSWAASRTVRDREMALKTKNVGPYRMLALALTEAGIAPGAWCAWSVDVWRRYIEPVRTPSVVWLCSKARVEAHGGDWFLSDLPLYVGGQAQFGQRHRLLINRWRAMRLEVLQVVERTGSLDRARRVVQRHFPEGVYEMLVERARDEARRAQELLMDQVAKGHSLW
jgi:hypothetical protein